MDFLVVVGFYCISFFLFSTVSVQIAMNALESSLICLNYSVRPHFMTELPKILTKGFEVTVRHELRNIGIN